MSAIQMISDTEFKLTARGCDMTLKKERDGWAMYSVNAMVRAYNHGYATPKLFGSLADVEAKYKTWRGVSALAS